MKSESLKLQYFFRGAILILVLPLLLAAVIYFGWL
jgi:hypothetical protein